MSVPALADPKRFTIIDFSVAGTKLAKLLNEANKQHRLTREREGHLQLEYGLGGLSAVGAWYTSVRILPVVPVTTWHHASLEQLRQVVEVDLNEMQTDQRGRSGGQPYFYSPRFVRSGQNASADIQVQVDVSGLHPRPAQRDLQAYFVTIAGARSRTPIQSGPYLLYGGVRIIRELRVLQMSPHTISSEFDDYSVIITLEALSLVLLSHLCADHGSRSLFLSLQDWRRLIRSARDDEYEVTRQWVAAGQLRDGGELARRMARWLLEQPNISGDPPAPRNGIREAELTKEIDTGLLWVEGFFQFSAGPSVAAPAALQACELGKTSSAYDPQDRRLARGF
ncbi:hypothetical protein JCM10449v2_004208 [Rhodotorula kratochvilovae]